MDDVEPIEGEENIGAEGLGFENGFGDSHVNEILADADKTLGTQDSNPPSANSESSSALNEFLAKYDDNTNYVKPPDGPDGVSVFKIDANRHWVETDASGKETDHTQKIMESGDKQRLDDHLKRIDSLLKGESIFEERTSGKDISQDVAGGAKVATKEGTKYASLTFLKSDSTIGFEEREFKNKEAEQFPFQSLEEVSKSLDWSGEDWEKIEESKESQVLKKADKLTFAKSTEEKIEVKSSTANTSELNKETLESLHTHGYAIAETPEIRQILFADKNGKVSFEVYQQKPKEILEANDAPDDDEKIEKDVKQAADSPIRILGAKPKAEVRAIGLKVKGLDVLGKQELGQTADRLEDVTQLQKIFTITAKSQPEHTPPKLAEIVGISLVEDEASDYDEKDTASLRKQSPERPESQKPVAALNQHEVAPIFESFLALDAIKIPNVVAVPVDSETGVQIEVPHLKPELEGQPFEETFGISLNTAADEAGPSITEGSGEFEAGGNNIEEVVVNDLTTLTFEDHALSETAGTDSAEPVPAISIIETSMPKALADQELVFTAESVILGAEDVEASLVSAPINGIEAEELQIPEITQPIVIEQNPAVSFEMSTPNTEKTVETTFGFENTVESGIVLMEDEEAVTLKDDNNLKGLILAKPTIAKNVKIKDVAPTKVEFVKPTAIVQEVHTGIEIVGQDQKLDEKDQRTAKTENSRIARPAIPQIRRPNANLEKANRPETAVKTFTRTEPQAIKIDIQRTERQVSTVKEVREIAVKPENLKIPVTDKKELRTTSVPSLASIQSAPQRQQVRLTREAQRLAGELTALSKLSSRPSPTRPGFWNKEITNKAITSKPASAVQDKEEVIDNNSGVYERELALAA